MIKLRKLTIEDLEKYAYWKLPIHRYHNFNGPYFKKDTEEEVKAYIEKLRARLSQSDKENIATKIPTLISNEENDLLGEVNWYWKSKETNWLEVGLVIFDEKDWGKGFGYLALKLWISKIFEEYPSLVRVGLSTWSGNIGMLKLAEKLGLHKEAEYKKARIVDGDYYDSVSFGILKEDWQKDN